MYVYRLIPGSKHDAHGGPLVENKKEKATPTQEGRFVVASIGQHLSGARWLLSTIPWGTPIRKNSKFLLEVFLEGRWQLLHQRPYWREQYADYPIGATQVFVQEYMKLMRYLQVDRYGLKNQNEMPAPWNGEFPKTWPLNDFGPVAVKYFRDTNNNQKMDGNETVLSDFIHTTPHEEIESLIGNKLKPVRAMKLGESHGCIHFLPTVMQDWITRRILKVGATVEVHSYQKAVIPTFFERSTGRLGIEIHFFPKLFSVVLYQVTRKQQGQPLHALNGHG
jgi:hypothetical protein